MEVMNILMRWKKTILLNVFYISLLVAVISLILPKIFTASAVLMPPSSQSDVSVLNAFSESELPFGGLISQSEEETMRLIAILKSRTVMETIINQYHLIDFYHSKNIEEALESLSDHVNLEIEEEGTLSITVHVSTGWFHYEEDEIEARELSAKIANEFVNQLDIVDYDVETSQLRGTTWAYVLSPQRQTYDFKIQSGFSDPYFYNFCRERVAFCLAGQGIYAKDRPARIYHESQHA